MVVDPLEIDLRVVELMLDEEELEFPGIRRVIGILVGKSTTEYRIPNSVSASTATT